MKKEVKKEMLGWEAKKLDYYPLEKPKHKRLSEGREDLMKDRLDFVNGLWIRERRARRMWMWLSIILFLVDIGLSITLSGFWRFY